jgi:periplasmic divalent cation tolerance protein
MYVGWTTVETREQAETLARGLIDARLAACVQIDGPIRSVYRWDGRVQEGDEYRLTVKYLPQRHAELETSLLARHPYQNPEWVVVRAEHVSEKYLSWAQANSTPLPL